MEADIPAVIKALALSLMFFGPPLQAAPVPGTLDVHWNAGAPDCEAAPQEPLQVHSYEPQTFILRQSPCAHFEANFLYVLIGSERALLIDTGAVADSDRMPLARAVTDLLPRREGTMLPLVVAHSHGHLDHFDGDNQLASLPSVEIVPTSPEEVRAFFGLADWPEGIAHLDLGGRTIEVMPSPGHHPSHVVFYDDRTEILFTGDFLLPGRLLIDDIRAYRASAKRVADQFRQRPVAHILGGHIELDADGELFPQGSQFHPNERDLALGKKDLLALPAALDDFNGLYARHENFVLVDPIHNLVALAAGVIVALILAGWGVLRLIMRRRRRRSAARLESRS